MKTRYIYITGFERLTALKSKYNFTDAGIKKGDHLFKLDELLPKEWDLIQALENLFKPFFRIVFSDAHCILIKIVPEKELLDELANYRSKILTIDDFIVNLINYFNTASHSLKWKLKNRVLEFKNTPLIMGILNTTPDSFSDAGLYSTKEKAIEHALKMIKEGADIIDIGGESSRPGAEPVAEEQEMARTVPVIEEIRRRSSVIISIDTVKSRVAEKALLAGADIVNDISSASSDPQMKEIIKKFNCPLVVMHMQGKPQNMQENPSYADVHQEVYQFLAGKCLEIDHLNEGKIIIDPGIGFGKTLSHNLSLIRDVVDFTFIGKPLLLGLSRKSFIGKSLNVEAHNRLIGSLISEFYSVLNGVAILRVHDVRETLQAKKMLADILAA